MTPDVAAPDAFALYTTIFLHHAPDAPGARRWLLLRRADDKRFAPGRWTGLGGRVEPHEVGGLRASALRELREDRPGGVRSGRAPAAALRAAARPAGGPLTTLLYYTAPLPNADLPPCDEGTLHWCPPTAFAELDVIETTAAALERLVGAVATDPEGRRAPALGWAHFGADGMAVAWSDAG